MARPRGETKNASRRHRQWLAGVRSGAIKLPALPPTDHSAMTFLIRSSRPIRPTRRGDR